MSARPEAKLAARGSNPWAHEVDYRAVKDPARLEAVLGFCGVENELKAPTISHGTGMPPEACETKTTVLTEAAGCIIGADRGQDANFGSQPRLREVLR
jgi:hypothetical protein